MSKYRIPPNEVVARGEEIYQQIRGRVDPGNHGRFVVIDVENGDYEIGDDDAEATIRLQTRRPGALTYGVRIGFPVAYTLGAHLAAQ